MGRGPELSPATRGRILALRGEGYKPPKIASITGVHRTTVYYTIKQAEARGPNLESLKRSGRPCKVTNETYLAAVRMVEEQQWSTSAQVESVYLGSLQLFRKRLAKDRPELLHKMASRQQVLSEPSRLRRLAFAQSQLESLNLEMHKDAWFTDECMFKPGQTSFRPWVWVPRGKSGHPRYTSFTPQRSHGLMIWGAIHADGRVRLLFPMDFQEQGSQIVTGDIYLEMLKEFIPQNYSLGQVWIHDNAPVHTARQCKLYLEEAEVTVLPWPPESPDLNVIENFWKILKQTTHERHPNLKTLRGGPVAKARQIKTAVLETVDWMTSQPDWDLPQRLINSWPSRLQRVVEAEGARTKY